MLDIEAFLKSAQQLDLPNVDTTRIYKCAEKGCTTESTNPDEFAYDESRKAFYCKELRHGADCHNCGEAHCVEDLIEHSGQYYCQTCADELLPTCPNCEERVEPEEIMAPTAKNRFSMKNGGCDKCSSRCSHCGRVVDNDEVQDAGGDSYCDDCFSEYYCHCEGCGETVSNDDSHYVEEDGNYCDYCFNKKFTRCDDCKESFPKDEMTDDEDGNEYCETCWVNHRKDQIEPYADQLGMESFSFNKKDRFINKISKLVPISVKDLKTKYPALAAGLQDLIVASKGKDITMDILTAYKSKLMSEIFPVAYSTWSGMQRSVESSERAQLVLNIVASNEMLVRLKSNAALFDLFSRVNLVSKESTHPYTENQLGWARLELEQNKNYVLVDEIQTDHANAAKKLKENVSYELKKIRSQLQNKYGMDDAQFDSLLGEYLAITKDFPEIANQAIISFAVKNGYKKLFWHTYESGKKLKDNDPPRSLYEKTPKDHFFTPSQEKPFDLDGEFFEREAKDSNKQIQKLARRFQLKKLSS
jgi:hypothetical protein